MKRILTLAAILVAAALSSLSWVSQARAQALTYVSSTGSDSADCASPGTACRSFAGALNKVADGGAVICAGVGEFSSPTITKSVTIDCLAGGGGTQSVRFIINAPGKIVRLRNIALSGAGVDSSAAIEVIAATNVFIENAFVTGHISNAPGIYDHRAGPAVLVIKDSSITNNSGPGIVVVPASGIINADLENVTSAYNSFGLAVGNGGRVTIKNSFFTNNSTAGVEGDPGSFIEVNSSKMAFNQMGVQSFGSTTLSASQIVSNTTAISGATQSSGNNQIVGNTAIGTPPGGTVTPPVGNCGMKLGDTVVFCDTFDNKNPGIASRTGDLDPNVWGVSRTIGDVNFGQTQYDAAPATTLQTCNGALTVRPPNDVIICNGQLREATNDNPSNVFDAGGVTSLAMYPKQPFDFAGRTGTVSFDVSNDSHGIHAAWPEFWISNLPVPVPFNHFDSWQALPQHGFGVRFAAQVGPGQVGLCPNGNNLDKTRWTVDSAVVVRNYIFEDVNYQGVQFGPPSTPPVKLNILDCVIAPPDNSGIMNHIELKVTQNQIDVYATDAGVTPSPSTLKHIASIANANLLFTRGLIWLEDVHYNADKAESGPNVPSQRQHTFVWDNVAFDGPFTYRDFSYDALDANQAGPAYGAWNLGKFSLANQTASWNVLNMPANPQAGAVRVLFDFSNELNPTPTVLNVVVNGHAHPTPWPYPDSLIGTWRTFAVTIPITDLVTGTNVVQLGSDQPTVTANVNIALVDVPGGVPVLPGSNNAYPTGGNF